MASVGRCSPRRLIVLAVCLSVLATFSIFIYSMNMEDHNHLVSKELLLRKLHKSNHNQLAKLRARANRYAALEQSMVNKRPASNEQKSGSLKKMLWPDKKSTAPKQYMHTSNMDPLNVPRISQYCNIPAKAVHGREGEAPAEYSLKSVYLLMRHGDRSPIYNLKTQSNLQLNCQFNSTRKLDIRNIDKFTSTLKFFSSRLHKSNTFPFSLYPNNRICENAQLTENGVYQHLLNGQHLHERYVKKWHLFSETFSPDQVYAKSTGFSRTYQSAIALLYAFLPKFNLTDLNIFHANNTYFCSQKSLGQSCVCPALYKLKELSERESALLQANVTEWKALLAELADILKTKQLPWISGMIDALSGFVCHRIPLPCNSKHKCINSSHIRELWRLFDRHSALVRRLESYQKYSKLLIHPLLHEISQHMLLTSKHKARVKFVLYSGHDLTVSAMLTALDVGKGQWPMYATRIVWELYSKNETKTHHFLRILVDGEDVTMKVSFCRDLDKNGFCKLKHFLDFIKKGNLALFKGQTFSQACKR